MHLRSLPNGLMCKIEMWFSAGEWKTTVSCAGQPSKPAGPPLLKSRHATSASIQDEGAKQDGSLPSQLDSRPADSHRWQRSLPAVRRPPCRGTTFWLHESQAQFTSDNSCSNGKQLADTLCNLASQCNSSLHLAPADAAASASMLSAAARWTVAPFWCTHADPFECRDQCATVSLCS